MLVGMGDSITAGFGARRGYGYFDLLVSNPPDESPEMKGICLSAVLTNLIVTNLSVSGSISHELAESQLRQLPRASTDTIGWVVITTGGNDLIHNYGRTPPREQAMYGATWEQAEPWIEKFGTRLETIVTGLTERFPGGCQVFLANIYDPTDGVGDMGPAGLPDWPDGIKILESYNEALRLCADRHPSVHLVNLRDEFLGHGIHCAQFWTKHYHARDPHYWYYANLEDPNERGYDAIRRLFLIEMAKAVKQSN
jgi:lysophospholipase L1-like esterase